MIRGTLFAIIVTLLFTSCATKLPIGTGTSLNVATVTPKPPIRHDYLSTGDLKRVRHPEYVKTYHLGRTATKNGRLMHEAHRVYQLEKSPRWNLLRGNPPRSSTGPIGGLRDSAFRPLPSSNQLKAEKTRQRELTEQLDTARQQTEGQLITLKARLAAQKDHAQQLTTLKQALQREQVARAQLEQQLKAAQPSNNHATDPSSTNAAQLRQWGEKQAPKP